MAPPRELSALPFAHLLGPHEGAIEPDEHYDTVLFEGLAFDGAEAGDCLFTECAFAAATFTGGSYRRSRFGDVWLHGVRVVGTDLAETRWLDTAVISAAFAGVEAFSTQWRRVVFEGCKLDSVNFRASEFTDVAFEDCVLRDVDWTGSKLTGVRFPGSALQRVRFGKTTMDRADFRGATRLDFADGYESLRGAVIDSGQVVAMAPMLAAALGVTVEDDVSGNDHRSQ